MNHGWGARRTERWSQINSDVCVKDDCSPCVSGLPPDHEEIHFKTSRGVIGYGDKRLIAVKLVLNHRFDVDSIRRELVERPLARVQGS